MPWTEIVFGVVLLVVLLAVALYFGIIQVRNIRNIRTRLDLPDEERRHEVRKAWRRLVMSGLLLVLAGLFAFLLVLHEPTAQRLADEREEHDAATAPPFTAEQRAFLRLWGGAWVVVLLVLMVVVLLAAIDQWAIRRHGLRQYRKLQADRRAMIARQATRMRREREAGE